jgi:hypothetical protein
MRRTSLARLRLVKAINPEVQKQWLWICELAD